MTNSKIDNVKLGVFVLAGLVVLIALLYLIGRNRNLFGSNFIIKCHFENAQGLMPGNNVRYAGIQAGTVRSVNLLNDTVIEVTMVIEKRMKTFIKKNAVASITTDGLMGNKMIAINPSGLPSGPVEEGDILAVKNTVQTDEMLEVLSHTNNDVALIASELKYTVRRINNSTALWAILNDETLPKNLQQSLANVRQASVQANQLVRDLERMVADTRSGKGMLGAMLTDTSLAQELHRSMEMISTAATNTASLSRELERMAADLRYQADSGHGAVHALFRDSSLVRKINNSLTNIEMGTRAFNENMEALRHNFLFRGYFRKQERKKKNQ
jgi:phospholipid/cholesterol/gamma-HCH transport system substrate-binding protein